MAKTQNPLCEKCAMLLTNLQKKHESMHCSRDYGVLYWIQSDLGVSKANVMHGGTREGMALW